MTSSSLPFSHNQIEGFGINGLYEVTELLGREKRRQGYIYHVKWDTGELDWRPRSYT